MTQTIQVDAQPLLSIAIPTHNRNKQLFQTLSELLPQVTSKCEVVIIDNFSPIPVADTVAHLVAHYPNVQINIIRNRSNIGANANISRCVELANGKYVWVLSDDDHVLPDALRIIFSVLNDFPDLAFVNFQTEMYLRRSTQCSKGLHDFILKMDSFANVLFISTSIFSTAMLRENLRFAYHYSYSMAPLFAALLVSLRDDHVSLLSDRQIVKWVPPSQDDHWPQIPQVLGMMTLLELPLCTATRRQLARKLVANCTPIGTLTLQLLQQALETGDRAASLFYYDHVHYRLAYYESNLYRRLRLYSYRLLLISPTLSAPLLRLVLRCLRHRGRGPFTASQSSERL